MEMEAPFDGLLTKNIKRAGDDGKREKAGVVFPLPIVPRALYFSFSPASLQHSEASVGEWRREEADGYNPLRYAYKAESNS